MTNPWFALPPSPDYVLPGDRSTIERHNTVVRNTDYAFVLDLLPEPFLGPKDPRVVMLNLNPGFAESDYTAHTNQAFSIAARETLLHSRKEWPMYLLDPRFQWASGAMWWRSRLRRLAEAVGDWQPVGHHLLVVEMFGYHSRRFRRPQGILPSVAYGAELVSSAMRRDVPIVIMRARRQWLELVPGLGHYQHLHQLSNPRSPYVSRKSCAGFFDDLADSLRGA